MAYISGYEGSMGFTGTSGVVVFSPASDGSDLKLDSWGITMTTDDFGALALGDAWETGFVTASEWTGNATFQIQSGLETAGYSGLIRTAANLAKTFAATFVTRTGEEYTGSGNITNMSPEVRADGGVQIAVEFMGDGKLIFAGTGV